MNQGRVKPFAIARVFVRNPRTGFSWKSPKTVKAFIDSGASMSIITPNTLSVLKEKTGAFDSVPVKAQTVNGEKEATALRNVSFCLNKVCVKGNVLVTDGISGDILIGSDFLSRARCKLDFDKHSMKCKGRSIKFKMEA